MWCYLPEFGIDDTEVQGIFRGIDSDHDCRWIRVVNGVGLVHLVVESSLRFRPFCVDLDLFYTRRLDIKVNVTRCES